MHIPEHTHTHPSTQTPWGVHGYTLLAELSSHPGKRFYLAQDAYGKQVLLKQFQPDPDSTLPPTEQLQRFRQACEIHLFLQHPRILPASASFEFNGHPCLVMDYLPGPTLEERLRVGHPFTLLESLSVIQQLCQVLHYLHEQGILHQDLRPANILLHGDHQLYLCDFDCARQVFVPRPHQLQPAPASLPYLSPEQVMGHRDLDYRSDIFSVGVIFYQLLTGSLPFKGETPVELVHHLLHHEPPKIQELNPWVPPGLEQLILKTLQKDRDYRLPTARKLAQEIEQLLEDADIYFAEGCLRCQVLGEQDAARVYGLLALQKNPHHLPALEMLGQIYQTQAQWSRARRCYERLLELQPETGRFYFALSQIERAEGYLEAAYAHLEQALQREPSQSAYLFEMAQVLQQLNRHYESLSYYQQLIQIRPDWEPPYTQMGHIYHQAGHKEAALDYYHKAWELEPQAFKTRYHLAVIYHELGNYEQALQLYLQLLPDYPECYEIRHNLANLYYQQGNLAQAQALLENLLDQRNWPHEAIWEMSYRLLGYVYAQQSQPEKAIEAFKHAIICQPEQIDAYLNLAYAYREALRLEEAIKTLLYLSQLPSAQGEATVWFLLARAYFEQGKEKKSLEALQTCLQCSQTLSPGMLQQVQQDIQFLKQRLAARALDRRQEQPVQKGAKTQQSVLLFSAPQRKNVV